MNAYQQERETKVAEHEQLTADVVALLDDGWTLKEYDNSDKDPWYRRAPDIVHKDGRSFDLAPVDGGKVRVSANWPTQRGTQGSRVFSPNDLYNPNETSPSIKVSLSRGTEVLAKEINRRFLPEFTRIWGRIAENIKATNEFEDSREAAFQRIRQECGLSERPGHVQDCRTSWHDDSKGYGDVVVNSAESVELKMRSLPVNVAIAVIKLVRGT